MTSQYLVFATTFAASVLISRFFLSPEEVGLYSLSLSAAAMISVLQDFGISRFVAGEPELDEAKIRTCFSVSILFALCVVVLLLVLAWPMARFYGDDRLLPLIGLLAISYMIVPFAIVPSALLQRKLDFRGLFLVNIGAAVASGGVSLGLAAAGFSAFALAWGAIAANLVRAVLAGRLSRQAPPFPLTLNDARPILRFGSSMSALYVSGAVGTRSPDLVIGRLIGIAATGIYSRASGLAVQLVSLVTGAVGGVFYPAFARIRDRGESMVPPYLRVVSGYTAVTWPALALLAIAAEPLILLLYGPHWIAVAPILRYLALSEMVFPALPLHIEVPILTGRLRLLLKLNIGDTLASVATLAIGAAWGLEAAAMSRLGYAALWYMIYALPMRRLIGFRWRDMAAIYARSAGITIAAIAPLGLLAASHGGLAQVQLATLVAVGALGLPAWAAALFAVRHPARHEMIGIVETALAKLRRRDLKAA